MSIPSQLPLIALSARAGALQALALQAGQIVDGKVVGSAPNGGTQVQISGQMLNLLMPNPVAAGTTVSFEVQGSGAQLRLALLPPPTAQPQMPVSQQAPVSISVGAQAAIATAPRAGGQLVPPTASTMIPTGAAGPSAPLAGAAFSPATPLATAPLTSPQAPAGLYPQSTSSTASPVVQSTAASVQSNMIERPAVTPTATAVNTKTALAQMVQAALPRQDSVGNLTSALNSIVGKVVLPEPVLRAAQRVLGGQVTLDPGKLDGTTIQKAIFQSGLFQEAQLAKGAVQPMQGDMKGSLLALRQTLVAWLGNAAALPPVAQVPPPLKGAVPRAKASVVAPVDLELGSENVGRQVLDRTENALARLRLHQHASLPDAQAKSGGDWSLDVPVLIGQHQTVLQFQIHRDQQNGQNAEGERGWQMRFAINLPEMGEVGAQISLRGQSTGVMLWGAEQAASAALENEVDTLRQALVEIGLKPGAIIVRHGEPAAPQAAPTGGIVDART